MKISTKGRYAIQLVIDVARYQDAGPVSLRQAAEREQISEKYLEQLARQLTRGGVLKSTRGAHGGYTTARPANELTAGDVLRVSEGTAPVACLEDGAQLCPSMGTCATIDFWNGLDKAIDDYVNSVSIATLVKQSREASARSKEAAQKMAERIEREIEQRQLAERQELKS